LFLQSFKGRIQMNTFYRLAFAMGTAIFAAGATNAQTFESAQPVTFTCTAPMTCPEVVVCHTPGLARLDRTVATLYRNRVLASGLGIAGVTAYGTPGLVVAPNGLAVAQGQWLAARNRCGCNASCLFGVYRQRALTLGGAVYAGIASGSVVE
jgi:uncharacterized protein